MTLNRNVWYTKPSGEYSKILWNISKDKKCLILCALLSWGRRKVGDEWQIISWTRFLSGKSSVIDPWCCTVMVLLSLFNLPVSWWTYTHTNGLVPENHFLSHTHTWSQTETNYFCLCSEEMIRIPSQSTMVPIGLSNRLIRVLAVFPLQSNFK